MREYKGGTALITGGATGIDLALARRLGREGMTVVIASTNAERLSAAAEQLRAEGIAAESAVCDVADREAVRALAARLEAEHAGVDLLCANAGATTFGPYLEHRDSDWDWINDVVLRGVTNCIQAFYPAMARRRSGQILITGSQTALAPDWFLQHGPYVAAKGALLTLAFALRGEAAEHDVGDTLLIPSATHTDIMDGQRSRQSRYGTPIEGAVRLREDAPTVDPEKPFFLSADEVAARAAAGLKSDAAIVATHAGMKPLVADWFDRILAAYDAADAFQEPAELTA